MRRFLFVLAILCASAALHAQDADETAIRAVLAAQAMAWNHGDITTFMQGYEDSPDTTFVGAGTAQKGFQVILGRYQKAYANKAQMGTLTFTNIEIRLLPVSCSATEYALVTGNFHLARTQHGKAKKDSGIFSLVWRKTPQGWKIILDHTS
ncbi:MAG TPA: nuclear transport factor 2 family protein [Terracidiphilus sp.]|nr:nuclear transport factor 2 family protein [Terracidiphilus sp.]